MKKNFLNNETTKVFLFNFGKLASYISGILLLFHGIHNLLKHKSVSLTILGSLVSAMFSQILTLPYKWDKFWIRISTMISLTLNLLTFIIYSYTIYYY